MCCARREAPSGLRVALVVACAVLAIALGVRPVAADDGDPTAAEVLRRADEHRGIGRPHAFLARITPADTDGGGDEASARSRVATVVEVRSNGFAQQLVAVLAPHRGDVILSTPDVVWLRPRRLHRLTRIPPELRMFNGASVSDVTTIDVVGSYVARFVPEPHRDVAADTDAAGDANTDADAHVYVLDLVATKPAVRYPRARYVIRRRDDRPLRIDFMARSGKVLKTTRYDGFREIAGRTIPTKLIVEDHVYGDASIVLMSEFRLLPPQEPSTFTPDHLLALPDAT